MSKKSSSSKLKFRKGKKGNKKRNLKHSSKKKKKPQKKVDLEQIAKKAMKKYGFADHFSKEVMQKVNALNESIIESQRQYIENCTDILWVSIDNFDTEDIDQIQYCERQADKIHIKVAVAEVDAFVPKDSVIDKHAKKNTTSVYTGIKTYPMLPDRLSENLTSLKPDEPRLAVITEFDVLKTGKIRPGRVYEALVINRAKLVYEQIGAWLEGETKAPKQVQNSQKLKQQILLQHEATQRLSKFRQEQGALELETIQTKSIIKDEQVLGLNIVEDDPAKRIIENFMVGANSVVSQMLQESKRPTIQRVIQKPRYWSEIVELAKSKGTTLPKKPNSRALAKFLENQREKNPKTFSDLSLRVVKMLGSAQYVLYDRKNLVGHFCLAESSYTHSTAPNRRYPDLIVQRLIKSYLAKKPTPYTKKELKNLAAVCTKMEHNAKKVERFVTKVEGAILLSDHVGETFDAIITGASHKGVYARIIEPPVEGKVIGKMSRRIKVGGELKVKLIGLDPKKGYIDFEIAN